MTGKKALSRNYFFANGEESAFIELRIRACEVARKMKALSVRITAAA
jgi:hypothetical protein